MLQNNKTPLQDLSNALENNPELGDKEKESIKSLTVGGENAVQASLVQLLTGQFTKVAIYDKAIKGVLQKLALSVHEMEPDELIQYLSVLTKVSTNEAKGILDLFKKNGDDMQKLIKDAERTNKKTPIQGEISDDTTKPGKSSVIDLSPEKKSKILKMLDKLGPTKIIDVEENEP